MLYDNGVVKYFLSICCCCPRTTIVVYAFVDFSEVYAIVLLKLNITSGIITNFFQTIFSSNPFFNVYKKMNERSPQTIGSIIEYMCMVAYRKFITRARGETIRKR